MLGAIARQARDARGWKLGDVSAALKEAGVEIGPGQISRMENGSRPGEPTVWGTMWTIYNLPLRDLYQGLGLPVPDELPAGDAAEIAALVQGMDPEARSLTLSFARNAQAMYLAAQRHSPLVRQQGQAGESTPSRSTRPVLVAEEKADYPARQAPGGPVDG